jgi:hypothetical protein
MPRQMLAILAAATLSAVSAVSAAQTAEQSGPTNSNSVQTEAAPVEHAYPNQNSYPGGQAPPAGPAMNQGAQFVPPPVNMPMNTTSEPVAGVLLRVTPQSNVQQVTSDGQKFELRVDRGVANVDVHDPGKDKVILVDLPSGQTQLLKNGLYTFNATTETVRVLKGEALAFPKNAVADAKPLKVKEDHKVSFGAMDVKSRDFDPYEASMDVLPGPEGPQGDGVGVAYGYDDGPYDYYPYYAYGWGDGFYPYGFYPGFGFAYYGGGFRGYRGGYGFHGGGYHGGGGFHGGGGGGFHGGGGGAHGGGGGHR